MQSIVTISCHAQETELRLDADVLGAMGAALRALSADRDRLAAARTARLALSGLRG